MPLKNKLPLHCEKCGHNWVEVFPLPMIMGAFVERAGHTLCPACGADSKKLTIK